MIISYKDLIRNKATISAMLKGQDPMTGKNLSESSIIRKEAVVKQLKQIKDVLNMVSKQILEISRWINIDLGVFNSIEFEKSITLNRFIQILKGVYKIDITYSMVAKLLEKEGYYEKNPENKPKFIASKVGLQNGMKNIPKHKAKIEETMVILNDDAQRLVLNLISKKVVVERNYWEEKGYFN